MQATKFEAWTFTSFKLSKASKLRKTIFLGSCCPKLLCFGCALSGHLRGYSTRGLLLVSLPFRAFEISFTVSPPKVNSIRNEKCLKASAKRSPKDQKRNLFSCSSSTQLAVTTDKKFENALQRSVSRFFRFVPFFSISSAFCYKLRTTRSRSNFR